MIEQTTNKKGRFAMNKWLPRLLIACGIGFLGYGLRELVTLPVDPGTSMPHEIVIKSATGIGALLLGLAMADYLIYRSGQWFGSHKRKPTTTRP